MATAAMERLQELLSYIWSIDQCDHRWTWVTAYNYIHRVREKNGPPKQNAVKCTVYNTIQWHLHSII